MMTNSSIGKRRLTFVLVLLICINLLPISVFAEEPETEYSQEALEEQAQMDPLTEGFDEDSVSVTSSDESGTENADSGSEAEDPVHEHSYVAVFTGPTCTEQGYTTYTCACGDSYVDDYTDAMNHPGIIDVPEVPATETDPGTTAGKKCALCGEVLEGCEEVKVVKKYLRRKFRSLIVKTKQRVILLLWKRKMSS